MKLLHYKSILCISLSDCLSLGETQKREQFILTGKASQGKLCLPGLEGKVGLRVRKKLSNETLGRGKAAAHTQWA